jgi:hypothetical protein
VVGTITSDGTAVIETPSSEVRRAAVVPGAVVAGVVVVAVVAGEDTDVRGTVSRVVALDTGGVAVCVELQPATRTAAISARRLTRDRPYEQGTASVVTADLAGGRP